MIQLAVGVTLQNGKYRIERMLGQGGFGITYLAVQSGLERKVAVKEFFIKELCERDESTSHVTLGSKGSRETVNRFRDKFLKEARSIASFNHPNIVRIIDVFEENGTAYYVMEFAENGSLADKVKRDGYLAEPVATRYILQVAEALDYIHQLKVNHLDVKPANIMLNEKDESVLIDFGLSKHYDAVTGSQTSTTPVGISEGYAAMEQYKQGGVGEFSPETDIYALGATFFKLLTGMTPPSASDVNEDGVPVGELRAKGVSDKAIAVICKAMEPRKKDRMKTVRAFIDGLNGSVKASAEPIKVAVVDDNATTLLAPDLKQQEEEARRREEARQREEEARRREEARKREEEARRREEARKREEEAERKAEEEKTENAESSNSGVWKVCACIAAVGIIAAIGFGVVNRGGEGTGDGVPPVEATPISYNSSSNTITFPGGSYKMVHVEGGTFRMGSNDVKPVHNVTLSSYYIGETEVTQELWKAVMGSNPSNFKGSYLPVEQVSWDDCQTFIKKLNSCTGQSFRLPTEAEWEYAAKGGNKSQGYNYSGSNNLLDVAWFGRFEDHTYDNGNSGEETHPVATKAPNELGIYDMSGNVWEWCQDGYDSYSSSAQTNRQGPNSGSYRVGRGGSWFSSAGRCRSSFRYVNGPAFRSSGLGLRLAL